MCYILRANETVLEPGIKLVNYLQNFPVVKLQTQEALQVEMIACTVKSIEPRYSASGVFTLGTGMITSITGTIISYVLIALQFQASNNVTAS